MKLTYKQRYTLLSLAAVVFILQGLLVPRYQADYDPYIANVQLIMGMVIMAMVAWKYWRQDGEEVRSDERTRKIGAYGITYSWMLSLFSLWVLFWADYLQLVTLQVREVILGMVLLMAISARVFQWYLFQKGDVN